MIRKLQRAAACAICFVKCWILEMDYGGACIIETNVLSEEEERV